MQAPFPSIHTAPTPVSFRPSPTTHQSAMPHMSVVSVPLHAALFAGPTSYMQSCMAFIHSTQLWSLMMTDCIPVTHCHHDAPGFT